MLYSAQPLFCAGLRLLPASVKFLGIDGMRLASRLRHARAVPVSGLQTASVLDGAQNLAHLVFLGGDEDCDIEGVSRRCQGNFTSS